MKVYKEILLIGVEIFRNSLKVYSKSSENPQLKNETHLTCPQARLFCEINRKSFVCYVDVYRTYYITIQLSSYDNIKIPAPLSKVVRLIKILKNEKF